MKKDIFELAKRICDCVSDGYDDEEAREEDENRLRAELEELEDDSYILAALKLLCTRVEDLEE